MQIFLYFVFWRLIDWIISICAPTAVPFHGLFSHPTTLLHYGLPQSIRSFANFDGVFYIRIAEQGYAQFEHAFFPLYPSLMRFVSPLVAGNTLLAGLILSNGCFLAGLYFFSRYLNLTLHERDRQIIPSSILMVLAFPTSFFLGSLYTEGVFFLLLTASFYFLAQKKYSFLFITSLLAALTRIVGVFLFLPILLDNWRNTKNRLAAAGPIIGIGLYMAYLHVTVRDPLAFFHAQSAFGAGRSTQLVLLPQVLFRYLKIFLTTPPSFALFVALVEFIIFSAVLGIVCYQLFELSKGRGSEHRGIVVFSLINTLLPTATGTLLSTPRFALVSLSVYIFLGQIRNNIFRRVLLMTLSALHVVLATYFIQGYFVS